MSFKASCVPAFVLFVLLTITACHKEDENRSTPAAAGSNVAEVKGDAGDKKIDEAVNFIQEKLASYKFYSRVDVDLDKKSGLMKLDFYLKDGRLAYNYTLDLKGIDSSRIAVRDNYFNNDPNSTYINSSILLPDNAGNVQKNGTRMTGVKFDLPTADYATRTATAFKFLMVTFGGQPLDPSQITNESDLIAFITKTGRKTYSDFQILIMKTDGKATISAGGEIFKFNLRDLDYDHVGPDEWAYSPSTREWRFKTINLQRVVSRNTTRNSNLNEKNNSFLLRFEQKADADEFVIALKRLAIMYGWKSESF